MILYMTFVLANIYIYMCRNLKKQIYVYIYMKYRKIIQDELNISISH